MSLLNTIMCAWTVVVTGTIYLFLLLHTWIAMQYEHLDFIWGEDAADLVYAEVVKALVNNSSLLPNSLNKI